MYIFAQILIYKGMSKGEKTNMAQKVSSFLPSKSKLRDSEQAFITAAKQAAEQEAAEKLQKRIAEMRKYEEHLLQQAELALAADKYDNDDVGDGQNSEIYGGYLSARQRKHYERQKQQAKANLASINILEQEHKASVQARIDSARQKVETDMLLASSDKEREQIAKTSLAAVDRAKILLQENTKPEIAHLLADLNIDLNIALSGKDTNALMQALLTCNEDQLDAIAANPKVPISVKIVIKRLKEDLKVGNIASIEKLWDRLFGKPADTATTIKVNQTSITQQMSADTLPQTSAEQEAAALLRGDILPNVPLSRKAYALIRETYICNDSAEQKATNKPVDKYTADYADYTEMPNDEQ